VNRTRRYTAAAAALAVIAGPVHAQAPAYFGYGESFVVPFATPFLKSVDIGDLSGHLWSSSTGSLHHFVVALSGNAITGAPLFDQPISGRSFGPSGNVPIGLLLTPGQSYAYFLGVPVSTTSGGFATAGILADGIPNASARSCTIGFGADVCGSFGNDDITGFSANFTTTAPEPTPAALLAGGLLVFGAIVTRARRRTV
jgi:hypothetical protein